MKLASVKPVFQEPRGVGQKFEKIIQAYYTSIEKGEGGLFLGVCRGRVINSSSSIELQ